MNEEYFDERENLRDNNDNFRYEKRSNCWNSRSVIEKILMGIFFLIFIIILTSLSISAIISHYNTARHKTNANYENLVSDTVEKRMAKNMLCDLGWSSCWAKKDLLLR